MDNGYGIYTNALDCEIAKNTPFNNFPIGNNPISGLFSDYPQSGGNANQILLRFGDLFGNGLGQIPTDAIIVSADITLNFLDSGDGSPLYRMLVPFDGNSTWDNFGGGVDQDDVESRSSYDSIIGLTAATTINGPNTGLGSITFSVLPDVKAWQGGQANYGWVLPGSDQEFDGFGISPGESTDPAQRPKLRITWVPAGTVTSTFRQGVNSYVGAQDTRLRAATPDVEASTLQSVFVDWAVSFTNDNDQALFKFENIIGFGAGQIRPNSIIHAAVLDLASTDLANSPGDGGTFHAMLAPWDHTNTWNSMVNGVTADDVEAASAVSVAAGNATRNPNVPAAFLTYELTSDVQAWVSGTRPNYGWVILPWTDGGDGWGIATSEAVTEIRRPQLRVYYTPGPAAVVIQSVTYTSTAVTIQFGGEIGTSYSVRRSGTVDGTYAVIGSATVQPNGVATFVDNAPLAGGAFYRISNP